MFFEHWPTVEVAEEDTQVASVADVWEDVGAPILMRNSANTIGFYIIFNINDSGQCDIRIRHRFHPTFGDPYENDDDSDYTLTDGTNELFVYETKGVSEYVQLQAKVTHHLGVAPADFQVIARLSRS